MCMGWLELEGMKVQGPNPKEEAGTDALSHPNYVCAFITFFFITAIS